MVKSDTSYILLVALSIRLPKSKSIITVAMKVGTKSHSRHGKSKENKIVKFSFLNQILLIRVEDKNQFAFFPQELFFKSCNRGDR